MDIMRKVSELPVGVFDVAKLKGTVFRSNGFFIFPGEMAIVTGPGKVFSAEETSTGHTVKISHVVDGRPYLTIHRHLASIFPDVQKNVVVAPGMFLGPVGDNPAQAGDPAHDHFELWQIRGPGATRERDGIDAQRLMEGIWKVVDSKTGEHLSWKTMGRVA